MSAMIARSFFIAPLVLSAAAAAQETVQPEGLEQRVPVVSGAHLFIGVLLLDPAIVSEQDFRAIAPGSELLARDLSDHLFRSDVRPMAKAAVGYGIGWHPFRDPVRGFLRRAEIRIGVSQAPDRTTSSTFYLSKEAPYDTLVSSSTGNLYMVDTTFHSVYSIDYSYERLGADLCFLFRSRDLWHFSFHGGLGLQFGSSFNARTEVRHLTYTESDPEGLGFSRGRATEGEVFRHGNTYWWAPYAVMGINWRMATSNAFWKNIHLFFDVRPMLFLEDVPAVGAFTDITSQPTFGIRTTFLK